MADNRSVPRFRLLTLISACALIAVAAAPGTALASPPAPAAANAAPTLDRSSAAYLAFNPVFRVKTWTLVPPRFSTDAAQALAAAKRNPTLQALHRREHPLEFIPFAWAQSPLHWYITFTFHHRVVAEVDVSPKGRVLAVWTGPQAITTYSRGHYAPLFDSWWIVVPFAIAFLVPFVDPRRLRRMLHLDALVLLSFMGSYALFDHLHLEAAVWLVYPPLLYLLGRMLWIGWRKGRESQLPHLHPVGVLAAGLVVLTAIRIVLGIVGHQVIDVSWASVSGAQHILSGHSLYGGAGTAHGDTYGPVMYLAYVPFLLMFPWHGLYGFVAAAKAASITFDVLTIAALVALGCRLGGGRRGLRLGLTLGWIWAACPFTLLAVMARTNDGLIALLSVLSLLVFASPVARGGLLGLAAAAKFSPGALLPLYAGPRGTSRKARLLCAAACVAVVVLAIGAYLPPGGLGEFYRRTIEFQLTRVDVFSPWALHPSLSWLKVAFEVLAVVILVLPALVRRERSLTQVAALAAAVTIAVQLPAVHWFYYYILWFLPFAAVALVAVPATAPATVRAEEEASRRVETGHPVLVGA